MSADHEIERLDWAQFLIDTYTLVEKISESSLGVSVVVGNNDNGVIPAYIIAKRLGMTYLDGPRAALHAVSNSGDLLYVVGYTKDGEDLVYYRHDCKLAAVYIQSGTRMVVKPDVSAREVSGGVVFPWDFSGN